MKYSFAGWQNKQGELVDTLGVANEIYIRFYASYSTENVTYNITWIVNGESITESYAYGETPTYKQETPTKATTAQYIYEFIGWDTPVSIVKEDKTYQAQFEATLRKYAVEWHFGKSVYAEEYFYGEMPEFKGKTSNITDEKYIYSFTQWNKPVEAVTGNTVYIAEFNKTSICENAEGDAIDVSVNDFVYNVSIDENTVFIDNLLKLAWANNGQLKLTFVNVGAEIVINETLVSNLIQAGCQYIHIYNNVERSANNNSSRYIVRFSDKDDNDITLINGVTVKFKTDITSATQVYSVQEDGSIVSKAYSYEDGYLCVKFDRSEIIILKNMYTVTVEECENGNIISDSMSASPGDPVNIKLWFTDEYLVEFIKVVGTDSGIEYFMGSEDSFVFEMPDEAVTVSAKLQQREYTIRFVVNGVVVSEKKYHKGDTVEIPADPVMESSDGKNYYFVGWTPSITTVNGDKTYTAEFKAMEIGVESFGGERGTFYLRLNLLVGGVSSLLIAAVVTIVLKIIKRKMTKL